MFHLHASGSDIADSVQVQTGMKSRSFMSQLPDRGPVIYLPTRDGVRGDGERGLLSGPTGAVEISSLLPPAFDLEKQRELER